MARGRVKQPPEIRAIKQDLYGKISKANKRIDRLRKQGFEQSPAQQYLADRYGKDRFSIRGYDTVNELRRLEGQLDDFLAKETSTVTGYKDYLTRIADSIGIEYDRKKDVPQMLNNYIEVMNKLEQYQNSQGGTVVTSDARIEAINVFIKDNDIDLRNIQPEDLVQAVDNYMKEIDKQEEEALEELKTFFDENWFDNKGD